MCCDPTMKTHVEKTAGSWLMRARDPVTWTAATPCRYLVWGQHRILQPDPTLWAQCSVPQGRCRENGPEIHWMCRQQLCRFCIGGDITADNRHLIVWSKLLLILGGGGVFDPLLILYVYPLTKKWSVYNFNGRFIWTVSDRIATKKSRKTHFKKVINWFAF